MSYYSAAGSNYDSAATCCANSEALAELKVYQACIFSVPVFFAFILLFLFYYFYLRRQSARWSSSLRMNASSLQAGGDEISRCELGLKKEVREMLPVIVFNESFSVKDSQCSVCLGDYQADDRLQQIPSCGHIFHEDCIDHWLSTHTTCPLCRHSLIVPTQTSTVLETIAMPSNLEDGTSLEPNVNFPEPETRELGE
ncbi:unnamed protein product [Cuscuta campestris]|uniref:RING-type E3 ubiquitin transferase n=1 Tax=Cuscuta campestris TaxID=132261 RepID=A0A484M082_9ASTE|nr:unnamed protein product [Cuscuta campestris]